MRLSGTIAWSGNDRRRRYVAGMQKRWPTLNVVTDPGGETAQSWRCHRLAWLDHRSFYGINTHHVVFEDDVIICPHFQEAATKALEALHGLDVVVSFYSSRKEVGEALDKGQRWTPMWEFWNCQAVCLPTHLIDSFVMYGNGKLFSDYESTGKEGGTDWRIRQFAEQFQIPIWLTVPSLAQHGEPLRSLLHHERGTPVRREGRQYGSKKRVASRYVEDYYRDARDIQWEKGAPRERSIDR